MRIPRRSASLFLVLGACAAAGSAQAEDRARALFQANCASCHGPEGAGDGWTRLDRPARSFRDGGFSFGNTPEALFRTITAGIPGTPMPSFEGSLSEEERRLLAGLVRALGPADEEVDAGARVLAVGERPLFVRGILPPIAEGAPQQPRGLLLGLPDGFTFEYRTDDLALLGVRQGEFVERSDWVGRGGTPLAPLGRAIRVLEGGAPAATFALAASDGPAPLRARLASTSIEDGRAWIAYDLIDGDGTLRARVRESVSTLSTSLGGGWTRRFVLDGVARTELSLRVAALAGAPLVERFGGSSDGDERWSVLRGEDGVFACLGVAGGAATEEHGGALAARFALDREGRADVRVTTVLLPTWSADTRAAFAAEAGR